MIAATVDKMHAADDESDHLPHQGVALLPLQRLDGIRLPLRTILSQSRADRRIDASTTLRRHPAAKTVVKWKNTKVLRMKSPMKRPARRIALSATRGSNNRFSRSTRAAGHQHAGFDTQTSVKPI